jgi:hypothetical protein
VRVTPAALCFDASRPMRLARFWSGFLGWEIVDDPYAGVALLPGFIGALACDGSQEVGYFWSETLGWPLVWDQDQETAIRSPHGGPKITWGGPPLMPRTGRDRLRFDVAPPVHGDLRAEADADTSVARPVFTQ